MNSILLAFITLFSCLSFADDNPPLDQKTNQIEVMLRAHELDPKIREMVFIAGQLQRIKQDYEAHPDAYYTIDYNERTPSRKLSLNEVIDSELKILQADSVIQADLSDLKFASDLISLIPNSVTQSMGKGFGFLADHYPTDYYPPTSDSGLVNYNNVGALIWTLSQEDGRIGEIIQQRFKSIYGYEIEENLNLSTEVKQANAVLLDQNRYDDLSNQIASTNAMLTDLYKMTKEVQNMQISEQQKIKLQQDIARKNAILRREVIGGMQLAGTVLAMAGKTEQSEKIIALSKITETVMNVMNDPNAGPLMMANVYVAAIYMAYKVISTSKEVNQMQLMFEAIQRLHEDMTRRFDIVDDKLDLIFRRLDNGLRNLQEGVDRMEDNLAEIQNALDDLNTNMNLRLNALYNRYHEDNISLCMSEFVTNYVITNKDFNQCLVLITNNLLTYSQFSHDELAAGEVSLANATFGMLNFPYVDYIPTLVSRLRNQYSISIINETHIRNPATWNKHAQSLIELWLKYPKLAVHAGNKPIQAALEAGNELLAINASLALKEQNNVPQANTALFTKVLADYKTTAQTAMQLIDQLATQNTFQIHPGLTLDQPLLVPGVPKLKNGTIKACKGANDFGVQRITYIEDSKGFSPDPVTTEVYASYGMNELKGKAPQELPLWKDAQKLIPNELLWLEHIQPGSVKFCFSQFKFNRIIFDRRRAQNQAEKVFRATIRITIELQYNDTKAMTNSIEVELPMNPWLTGIIALDSTGIILDYGKGYEPYPQIYPAFWSGHKDKPQLDGVVTSAETWAPHFVKDEDGFAAASAALQGFMDQVKPEVVTDIQHSVEFQNVKKALSEVRNALKIMLELGISDRVKERIFAQSQLYSLPATNLTAVLKSNQELRELDVILPQMINGVYNQEQILQQIDFSSAIVMEMLNKMNASGQDLRPRNREIEITIRDLKDLLRPELKQVN